MANGEWRMGEWRMANGEWRMANGEWRMANGEWADHSSRAAYRFILHGNLLIAAVHDPCFSSTTNRHEYLQVPTPS